MYVAAAAVVVYYQQCRQQAGRQTVAKQMGKETRFGTCDFYVLWKKKKKGILNTSTFMMEHTHTHRSVLACVHICAHLSYATAVLENVAQMSCAPKAALHHNNVCMYVCVHVQAINNYELEEKNKSNNINNVDKAASILQNQCVHSILLFPWPRDRVTLNANLRRDSSRCCNNNKYRSGKRGRAQRVIRLCVC